MKPGTPPDHRGSGPAVYRYHDPHDLIPRAGIAPERLRDEAGWEESDHSLVRAAARRLRGGRAASCADVGAGRGRLLPVLAEVADQVTVIEPDAGRLDAARGIAADLSYACWRFVHADLTTADLAGERFDLVVCSHVLQHLAHGNRAPFLACLRDMTAPGGLLVLMFSGTADGPGRLLLSVLAPAGETVLTRDATPAEFDAAAGIRGPGGEAGDQLPRASRLACRPGRGRGSARRGRPARGEPFRVPRIHLPVRRGRRRCADPGPPAMCAWSPARRPAGPADMAALLLAAAIAAIAVIALLGRPAGPGPPTAAHPADRHLPRRPVNNGVAGPVPAAARSSPLRRPVVRRPGTQHGLRHGHAGHGPDDLPGCGSRRDPVAVAFHSELRQGLKEGLSSVRLDINDDYIATTQAPERLSKFMPSLAGHSPRRLTTSSFTPRRSSFVPTTQVTSPASHPAKARVIVFIDNEPADEGQGQLGERLGRVMSDVETGARIIASYVQLHVRAATRFSCCATPSSARP